MLTETEFLQHAQHTLEQLLEALEDHDTDALLDIEPTPDSLTITPVNGKPIIISIHRASQQLWLASPRLGGLHFSYKAPLHWALVDGRNLHQLLQHDLANVTQQANWGIA